MSPAIARTRSIDGECQPLAAHLLQVGELTKSFTGKIGLPQVGLLLGLLHDFGKYSGAFQRYILSATGFIAEDSDEFVNPVANKGKVDHATAGAQLAWEYFRQYGDGVVHYAQMLALAVCSHHSGLIDCLSPDGKPVFATRIVKSDCKTHLAECRSKIDPVVDVAIQQLLGVELLNEIRARYSGMWHREHASVHQLATDSDCYDHSLIFPFKVGLLQRFLLSCLLDADRIDSACFEDKKYKELREKRKSPCWKSLSVCLENTLAELAVEKKGKEKINDLRHQVSTLCLNRAKDRRGLYTLTVPTGGGKTLASLRFALHHARKHKLDRIVYVIPYTSIIDQNARVARDILEKNCEPGTVVLEHHSNLDPEKSSLGSKLLVSNWDAPVVFTTMVQFLETLFGSGTRGVRRMHSLANSVIIFDEIQTLPVRCVHLFCNALNFLVDECGSTGVLCTATQPLLGSLPRPLRGQLTITPDAEIMADTISLFEGLQRVRFVNHSPNPMREEAICDLALAEQARTGNCLVITNTKKWAERVYSVCRKKNAPNVFYLSTNLCPAHRMKIFAEINTLLEQNKPVLCISTQLIECGVDISFKTVIRFAAGLDSILQAAGRCNRHGEEEWGIVHIVSVPEVEENLKSLPDIEKGRNVFLRVMREYAPQLESNEYDLTHPKIMECYFTYYFYDRQDDMSYRLPQKEIGGTLLRLLGVNDDNPVGAGKITDMRQAFASAAQHFDPIEAGAQGILVPYGKGVEIIAELNSASAQFRKRELLQKAQRYTVNIYNNILTTLDKKGALYSVRDIGIMYLDERYYHDEMGVCVEPAGNMSLLTV